MELIKTKDWLVTPEGAPRGYIQAQQLRELWFHTGTACNLACPFCLEGSHPGSRRLDLIKLADVEPYLAEAAALGVERISFTGGEPLVVRELPAILAAALAVAPVLVLSNGSKPLLRRLHELAPLLGAPQPLSFRISIDYADAARHDAGRGQGSFAYCLESLRLLLALGFKVSVARQQTSADEDVAAVNAGYQALFAAQGLPTDIPMVWFPDFATPFSTLSHPEITEDCMTRYHTAESRAAFMCAFSRMLVKDKGRMRVYACTLVDDDPRYDLGDSLAASLQPRVMLRHHRCFSCFKYGASCSEL